MNPTSSTDFSTDSAVYAYLPLMHELATRVQLVASACEGRLNLEPSYAREYSYLQFRYICELIALGCLQLHGDLPQAKKSSTKKEWNADKIMKVLHRDYESAFPQPAFREYVDNIYEIKCNTKPNALNLAEFKLLYFECGEVLHRGTIRSINPSCLFTDHDYKRILHWQSKIVDLMNEHLIPRANGVGFYLISLKTTSGYPECSIFNTNQSGGFDVMIRTMNIVDKTQDKRLSNLPILY